MGETSPERPTFSSVSIDQGCKCLPWWGQPACLLAYSLSALALCQALLLFNTLQEAAPNTGPGNSARKERIDASVKPGGGMWNTFGVSSKERCALKICMILCGYRTLKFRDVGGRFKKSCR